MLLHSCLIFHFEWLDWLPLNGNDDNMPKIVNNFVITEIYNVLSFRVESSLKRSILVNFHLYIHIN